MKIPAQTHLAGHAVRTGDGEPVEHEGEDNADRPETNDLGEGQSLHNSARVN
jgi:hypothetical protein